MLSTTDLQELARGDHGHPGHHPSHNCHFCPFFSQAECFFLGWTISVQLQHAWHAFQVRTHTCLRSYMSTSGLPLILYIHALETSFCHAKTVTFFFFAFTLNLFGLIKNDAVFAWLVWFHCVGVKPWCRPNSWTKNFWKGGSQSASRWTVVWKQADQTQDFC